MWRVEELCMLDVFSDGAGEALILNGNAGFASTGPTFEEPPFLAVDA